MLLLKVLPKISYIYSTTYTTHIKSITCSFLIANNLMPHLDQLLDKRHICGVTIAPQNRQNLHGD